MARKTFQRQLTQTFIIGIIVLAVSASIVTSWQSGHHIRGHLENAGLELTAGLAQDSVVALLTGASENAVQATATAASFPGVTYVAIHDSTGQRLADTGRRHPAVDHLIARPYPAPQLAAETDAFLHFVAPVVVTQDSASISEIEPAAPVKAVLGNVVVCLSKAELEATQWTIFRDNLLVSLAVATVLLSGLLLVARRLTAPLEHLASVMYDPSGYHSPLSTGKRAPREIATIARAFAAMVATVRQRDRALRTHAEHLEEQVAERTHALVEARDAALAASRAKSQFLANMSHELRTPLNSVIVLSELLARGDAPDRQHDHARVIQSSAVHLLGLIDQILDLAKIESGKLLLSPRQFSLSELLCSVEAVVKPQAEQKGLRWMIEEDRRVPRRLMADEARLRQLLVNLAGNAVKFTPQGAVTTRVKLLTRSAERVALRLEIVDTGPGIAPDKRETIFEPFSQETAAVASVPGGAGLGLTIAKQLVELMGGRIGVESVPGEGTAFWVELECATVTEHSVDTACTTDAPAPGVGARVLVAEDNQTNQYVLEQLLLAHGHNPLLVDNGVQALAALRRGGIAVAVLDYRMPRKSGLEVAREWRASGNADQTPVVILTADATDEVLAQCRATADAVQTKPIVPDQLLETIDELIVRSPPRGPDAYALRHQ